MTSICVFWVVGTVWGACVEVGWESWDPGALTLNSKAFPPITYQQILLKHCVIMHACLVGVASLVKDLNNLICFSFAFCFLKIKMQLPLSRIFIKITTEIGERESTLAMVCPSILIYPKKKEKIWTSLWYIWLPCVMKGKSALCFVSK